MASWPRWVGSSFYFFLLTLKCSEIRSYRWAVDVGPEEGLEAAVPAKASAFSFPGTPECPLTHPI